eukprot:TRINITY_DN7477_c0_g6_i1.p1 TRINITY_DN7477_c0_g6~~TRINITY_DN7477_c0_g6_i1.p1  ORF type:complete len:1106 (+),score=123.62 TRINITY_DN7477_c0_g6_i1:406-3318(+)
MAYVPPESIYIFGGFTDMGFWDDLHLYNISSNTFTNFSCGIQVEPPTGIGPQRLAFVTLVYAPMDSTAAQDDHQLFVFGGMQEDPETGTQTYSNTFWSYSIASNHWTEITASGRPQSRIGHGVVYVKSEGVEYLVVFGGLLSTYWYAPALNYLNDLYAYGLVQGTWQQRLPSGPGYGSNGKPAGRWGMGVSCIPYQAEDQVVIFGGQAYENGGRVYKNDLWAYSMLYNFWTFMIATNAHPSGRFGMAFPRAPYDAEGGIQDQIFAIAGGDRNDNKADVMYSYAVPIPTTTTSTTVTATSQTATTSTGTTRTSTSKTATSSTGTSSTATTKTTTNTTPTSTSHTSTSQSTTTNSRTTETISTSTSTSVTSSTSSTSITSTTSSTSSMTSETTSTSSSATTSSVTATSTSTSTGSSTSTTATMSSTSSSSLSSTSATVTSETSSSSTFTTSTSNTSSQTTVTTSATSSTYTSSTYTTETITSSSSTMSTMTSSSSSARSSTSSSSSATNTTSTTTSAAATTLTTSSSTTNSSTSSSSVTRSSITSSSTISSSSKISSTTTPAKTGSFTTSLATTGTSTASSSPNTTTTWSKNITNGVTASGTTIATTAGEPAADSTTVSRATTSEGSSGGNVTTSSSGDSGSTTGIAGEADNATSSEATASLSQTLSTGRTSTRSSHSTSSSITSTTSTTSTSTSITKSATTITKTTSWLTTTSKTLHFGILMGGITDQPVGTTSFDTELSMDVAKFNADSYKASVLAAASDPVNAVVEIDSISFNVIVQYSFDGAVTQGQTKSSVAAAASVPASQVSVTVSNTRRLAENEVSEDTMSEFLEFYVTSDAPRPPLPRRLGKGGRRLPSTADARVSTTNQTAVDGIANNVADPDRVKQAMQAEGVSSSVRVARAPTLTVAVSTRIMSGTSEPVSVPDSTTLQRQLSTDLGTEVGVTVTNVHQVASAVQSVISPLLWGIVLLSSC